MTHDVAPHDKSTRTKFQIDREHFEIDGTSIAVAALRALPSPPIGEDRDLYRAKGGNDERFDDPDSVIEVHNGDRFYTAPRNITPGGDRALGR
jgi:hypothetical protein